MMETKRIQKWAVLALFAAFQAAPATAEVANVAAGFTTPPTLVFAQAAGVPVSTDFTEPELDTCNWELETGGGYTGFVDDGKFVISGTGFGSSGVFVGAALSNDGPFSDASYTLAVGVSESGSATHGVRVQASSSSSGSSGYRAEVSTFRSNDGSINLNVQFESSAAGTVTDSLQVVSAGAPNALPYEVSLYVDRDSGTITGRFENGAGLQELSLTVTVPPSPVRARCDVNGLDGTSLSLDHFHTSFAAAAKYRMSRSPLSVFGEDYSLVPFGNAPVDGLVHLDGASGSTTTIAADDTCVAVTGDADLSATLVTFSGPARVTLVTDLSQPAITGIVNSFDPGATVDCYGTMFSANGAGNDYTAVFPDCVVPATPTPTPPVEETPTPTPTPTEEVSSGCPATPPTCRGGGKASLAVADKEGASKDSLSWKLGKATDVTLQDDFGNPATGATGYQVCVYDSIGSTAVLSFELDLPAGGMCDGKNCWVAVKDKGYRYKSKTGAADGVTAVQLKAGDAGKGSLSLKAKGANLILPEPATNLTQYNQDPAVTIVLRRTDSATCWSSSFTAAGTAKNEPGSFKAKAP